MTPPIDIGLISNPRSGHNREQFEGLRGHLDGTLGDRHRVTRDAAQIPSALQSLRDSGTTVLAINGGDGTVAAILGALLEMRSWVPRPEIMVLPAGTANMTAGDVGLRGRLRRAVQRFCTWAASGSLREVSRHQRCLLRLRGAGHARYGFFLGGGAVITGTEFAHRSLHAHGLRDDFSLALGVARTMWGIARRDPRFVSRTPLLAVADASRELQVDGLILAISTLQRLAFGMRPFWGHGPGGARLTLLEHGCHRFVPNFLRIIAGHPGAGCRPERGYHSLNFDSLRLSSRGTLNFDGELLDIDGSVDISATDALTFLRL